MNSANRFMPDEKALFELAKMKMPFGKYKGRLLIDLPEPYMVWFNQKGFPSGKLGDMLRTVYEIRSMDSNIFLSRCGIFEELACAHGVRQTLLFQRSSSTSVILLGSTQEVDGFLKGVF